MHGVQGVHGGHGEYERFGDGSPPAGSSGARDGILDADGMFLFA